MTAAQTFQSASGGTTKASEAAVWVHGPGGSIAALPPRFIQRTLLLFAEGGMNEAAAQLGSTVRSWHSAPPKLPDKTLTHLGYWTGRRGTPAQQQAAATSAKMLGGNSDTYTARPMRCRQRCVLHDELLVPYGGRVSASDTQRDTSYATGGESHRAPTARRADPVHATR